MARHHGPVLVNTNAILESFRVGSWRALPGGYGVETVEDCIIETQTGYQRRRPEQQIEEKALRESIKAVHAVTDKERAVVAVRAPDIALDSGEKSLWAHTLTRPIPPLCVAAASAFLSKRHLYRAGLGNAEVSGRGCSTRIPTDAT